MILFHAVWSLLFFIILNGNANGQQPCIPNPCRQGNCVPNGASFRCDCFPQYSGLLCDELTINPCQPSNPCYNGGVCTSNDGKTFKCTCSPSYTGLRCENRVSDSIDTSIGPCKPSNPCYNGGVCTSNDGKTFKCNCAPGFQGVRCENRVSDSIDTSIGPCKPSNPCYNGGICTSNDGITFKCVCVPGFEGIRCEKRIVQSNDPCKPNPCQYSGTCIPITGATPNFACVCGSRYTGQRCELLLTLTTDVCKSTTPCLNGGTCVNVPTGSPSYACICSPGWTGINCGQRTSINTVTACLSNPCSNGGTCIQNSFGYSCQCAAGFKGLRCEQRELIDLCNSQVCYNGGTCQTQALDNFQFKVVCFCKTGFTGSRCEISINSQILSNALNCQNVNCNSGKCVNQISGFRCECPVGVSYGVYCENVVSNSDLKLGCGQPYCLNGGTCYTNTTNVVSFPVCICQRGYLGLLCEFDVCKQSFDTGVCNGSFTRYYYNSQLKRCEAFTYGGCRGNTNNFETKAECELVCNGR